MAGEVVWWKIWYDDGVSTFSISDGSPEAAPLDGVHGIVQRHANNSNEVLEGQEYYRWTGDRWVGGRINDLERWLRVRCPELKYGRYTKDAIHQKIMKELYGH